MTRNSNMQTELTNVAVGTVTFHDNGFRSKVVALLSVCGDESEIQVEITYTDRRKTGEIDHVSSADEAIEVIQANFNHLIAETPPPWIMYKIDWAVDSETITERAFRKA